jgi:hypothetical protein
MKQLWQRMPLGVLFAVIHGVLLGLMIYDISLSDKKASEWLLLIAIFDFPVWALIASANSFWGDYAMISGVILVAVFGTIQWLLIGWGVGAVIQRIVPKRSSRRAAC